MKTYTAIIKEITPVGLEQAVTVEQSSPVSVISGQFFRAFVPSSPQVIPVPVYPYKTSPGEFLLCGRLPAIWHPADEILLQGPYGNGFSQILKSRRLLLYAFELALELRLFHLALHALQHGADVAWVSDNLSLALPPQVEVLKTSELPAALEWSDGCALALPFHQSKPVLRELPLTRADRSKIEVFMDAPLVCGNARCGVCAVESRKGFKLACKDGPVFPLEELQVD